MPERRPRPDRWQVLQTPYEKFPFLVAVCDAEPDKLLHGGGPSYMMRSDHMEVLDEYPVTEWPDADAVELHYLRTYCKIASGSPCPTGGWIGPDGSWYSAAYAEHDNVAYLIMASKYNRLGGTRDLERTGWLRLHDDGLPVLIEHDFQQVFDADQWTQAQRDTLMDIWMAAQEGTDFWLAVGRFAIGDDWHQRQLDKLYPVPDVVQVPGLADAVSEDYDDAQP